MRQLVFSSIGRIRTPFIEQAGTPIQSANTQGAEGTVEVDPHYLEALSDLDGFDRIWLIYAFDRTQGWSAKVVPYLDTEERGIFATRAPRRPNPIGMSMVELLRIEGNVLHVRGIDVLDNTPLIDIKPYVPDFDACPNSRAGWYTGLQRFDNKADDRFST
jgi:tRNA-Thr(GGU) m(6)t(6)A37 methyltransferase TsaA